MNKNPICRKCGGECKVSTAFKPLGNLTLEGENGGGSYFSDADTTGLIYCHKCENCGHSFTLPKI